MSVSLSGLVSGFDWQTLVDQLADVERAPQTQLRSEQDTINQRNNAYGSIKTELSVLQSRVAALKEVGLFDGRTASVSDAAIARAVAGNGTPNGSYLFSFTQLATAAKRLGTSNVGSPLDTTSALSNAGFSTAASAGTFTINGQQIAIAATDTLETVFSKISSATGNSVTASYDSADDKIELSSSGEILLGSATDTSNFLQAAKLFNNGTGEIVSRNSLGGVLINGAVPAANLATPISDGGGGSGEFRINGVSIAFDAGADSIASILSRINNSTAGVTASYDSVADRFVLTNKTTGDLDIVAEDVTGNFLAATGLASGSLARGKNLLYSVNGGETLVSQSNTITEASSGIAGLSVTALEEGATATVTVAADVTKIKDAINSFIEAYNRAQSLIETQTASSTDAKGVVTAGVLATDSDASEIASRLRSTVYSLVSGLSGTLDHLGDLGITTSGDDNKLTLSDEELLDTALNENRFSLQQLFADGTNGIAVKLSDYLERTIGEGGTLAAKQDGLTTQARDIDTQIADLEKIVQANRQRMIENFVAMETAQARINQQLEFLLQRFGTSS